MMQIVGSNRATLPTQKDWVPCLPFVPPKSKGCPLVAHIHRGNPGPRSGPGLQEVGGSMSSNPLKSPMKSLLNPVKSPLKSPLNPVKPAMKSQLF